ncbi:MAG: energy-coupling factor transport system permease protein [Petroclostridium sp.]|jgi:energy-coupling factor transport system permease protein|uniref:energy-coupling factor transporter transmembrane component T family protein n=1 Tax=Petroclostridium xylanilyticum TaxID=1792311 RepID=UPI000B996DD0|nr:energy-coupling factor transporter transmembrane component T [Petroclostridium xylanilyticum]MBZ4645198.1 energy-coupling factor transporter transrane protein EcfT [Clostridia bacterium]MDK2809734.1 energy-coupling factor transport system permease protein [Petroclostridium sp.]
MIRDITLGQYFPGESVIHRLDPRIKIILTLLYIAALFMIKNFTGYIIFAAFTFQVIHMSTVPVKYVFRGLKPLIFIIILTAFINMFMTGGTTLFIIGPLRATHQGLEMAVLMTLRLLFLIIGTSLLTFTTSPILLTDGIEKLLNPFKKIGVPAHELAMMMTIALRFIPTLLEETDKIMKAQMARGADFESGNLLKRAKGLVPLLVPLFISAFRRADELAIAMESRCYRGGDQRTRMKQLELHNRDYIALAIVIGLMIVLFFVRGLRY